MTTPGDTSMATLAEVERVVAGGARTCDPMIVDAHQHFWDPARAEYPWMTDDVAPLRRRFGPEDLEPLVREHGVTGTVVVQARPSLDETRDLLAIAASTPFVLGVVGWVDLTGDVAAQLAEFEDVPLVGIRHLVHDETDPEWLLREDVQRGLAAVGEAGLVYDLLVRVRELPAAIETARSAQPACASCSTTSRKRPPIAAAQRRGNVASPSSPNTGTSTCKISGLFTEAEPAATAALALRAVRAGALHVGLRLAGRTLATAYGDGLRSSATIRASSARRRSRFMGSRCVGRVELGPELVGNRHVEQPHVFLDLGGVRAPTTTDSTAG